MEFAIAGSNTCSEINTETGQAPSELLRYQTKIPTPGSAMLGLASTNSEDATMTGTELFFSDTNGQIDGCSASFKIQTCLRSHLNNIYRCTFGQPKSRSHRRKIADAISALRQQVDCILLDPLATRTENRALTARALAAYWEARSYGALPSLLRSFQTVDLDEISEAVCSITETVRASHCLEDDRLILPNAFGTAML